MTAPQEPTLPLDVTPVCPDGCGKPPAEGRRLCREHQREADARTLHGLLRFVPEEPQ